MNVGGNPESISCSWIGLCTLSRKEVDLVTGRAIAERDLKPPRRLHFISLSMLLISGRHFDPQSARHIGPTRLSLLVAM
jgi:hypothetical protein